MQAKARRLLPAAIAAALFALGGSAYAGGRIAVEGATAQSNRTNVDRYGVNLAIDWDKQWFRTGNWYLTGYWEAGIDYWDGAKGTTGNDSLVDFSVTPVFRIQRDVSTGLGLFMEAGVGLHGYTDHKIDDKDFDIPFAFGSHIGAGTRFGPNGEYELMYRYQHQSNASIGDRNPGINFHIFTLGYHF